AVWAAAAPLAPAAARPEPVSPEQKQAIDAERSPEKLIELAKEYHTQRSHAAATAAITKAVSVKPALLADAKPQSPPAWNEFWYTQRALIAEQKLPRTDAAGRVKLAQWLYDARL